MKPSLSLLLPLVFTLTSVSARAEADKEIIYDCTCSYSKDYEPYQRFEGKGLSTKSEQEAREKSCMQAIALCKDHCRFTGQACIWR